jgi:hypothetical protein
MTVMQRPANARQREIVRGMWGVNSTSDIGNRVKLSVTTVRRLAAEMNLGESRYAKNGGTTSPAPSPPKGIPEATLSWARASASVSREAAMILALAGNDVRKLGWR